MKKFKKNKSLLLLVLPGFIWLIIFSYIPMFGVIIAFKNFRISTNGFFDSLKKSPWVGLDNFKFLFKTDAALQATKNTMLYNLGFIIVGTFCALLVALLLNEIRNKKLLKFFQTQMLFPYFLSWVVVSYFVFIFISDNNGIINKILTAFGGHTISWYTTPKVWPFLLIFLGIWKSLGYNSIIYYASILAIDKSYYEAAMMDGASKLQQIKKITLPLLTPIISVLLILSVGNIMRADFGLFFQVTQDSGALYQVSNVLDTYIYHGLTQSGDMGMTAAAGLYQSGVGLILILLTNFVARKIDDSAALF